MKKISDAIKELESLKEQHGDLPVVYADSEIGTPWEPVFTKKKVRDESSDSTDKRMDAIEIFC